MVNDVVQCCLRCLTPSPANGRRSSWSWCWSSARTRSRALPANGTTRTTAGSRSPIVPSWLQLWQLFFFALILFAEEWLLFRKFEISRRILLTLCWCNSVNDVSVEWDAKWPAALSVLCIFYYCVAIIKTIWTQCKEIIVNPK